VIAPEAERCTALVTVSTCVWVSMRCFSTSIIFRWPRDWPSTRRTVPVIVSALDIAVSG